MKHRRIAPLLLAALIGTSTLGIAAAWSQTPLPTAEEDPLDDRSKRRVDRMEKVVRELRAIVFQGRDTGRPVVVQSAETEAMLQALTLRVDDLESSLQRLNAANETLTHELDTARRSLQALEAENRALADRLTPFETAAQAQAAAAQTQAQIAAETPEAAFGKARQLMLDGDYDGAETAFEAFVEHHGDAKEAAEAHYWLGKTLSVRNAHAEAAQAYIASIRGYPKTSWAPDAMVELSRTLVALKKTADACKTLTEFGKRYPKPPTAVANRAAATRTQAKCAA